MVSRPEVESGYHDFQSIALPVKLPQQNGPNARNCTGISWSTARGNKLLYYERINIIIFIWHLYIMMRVEGFEPSLIGHFNHIMILEANGAAK